MTLGSLNSEQLARLFSLGANDLRTPLAILNGYTRTISRGLEETGDVPYMDTVEESVREIEAIVERLALSARICEGRYMPTRVSVRIEEIAAAVVVALEADRVEVSGVGGEVMVDRPSVEDALTAVARAMMRHGAIDLVKIDVANTSLSFSPVHANARPVLAGEEIREFGISSALLVLESLGGECFLEAECFVVRLPTASVSVSA
tara:strand:- start:97 stop:711 length:615 start_codon:yes stop_codon:yes gene_type:complete